MKEKLKSLKNYFVQTIENCKNLEELKSLEDKMI
jgi:hypothetical protein